MVVLAKYPATVLMYGKSGVQVVDVLGGLTRLSRNLEPGDGIKIEMRRNEVFVAECSPSEFKFNEGQPLGYNFNAYTAHSS